MTHRLIIEAIRRLDKFHSDEDPRMAWSGLGFKSEYKPVLDAGLMEWVSPPSPRCMGWLRLTAKGLVEVKRIRDEHGEPMVFDGYTLRLPTQRKVA